MEDQLEIRPWAGRSKWLVQGLIVSGALNLGFLAAFIVSTYQQRQEVGIIKGEPLILEKHKTYIAGDSVEVICNYFTSSYEELLVELGNECLVEDGYAKRDYALACLVAFHYFDIQKALVGISLQTRYLEFVHQEGGERIKLEVFSGLNNAHFEALYAFAKVEKWPFTPQGLYVYLQRMNTYSNVPDSLKEAFYLTPHFHYLWRLFNRSEKKVGVEELLQLAFEVQWDVLDKLYREFVMTEDLSEEMKRHVLIELVSNKSSFAAKRFLQEDRDFALNKLDDSTILYLLSQLSEETPQALEFARQLLVSVRSDSVLKAAAYKLYTLVKEIPPHPYDHTKALARFLPQVLVKDEVEALNHHESEKVNFRKVHLVVKGDTLWKVAHDYHVSLSELIKINHLTAISVIRPGMKLDIPSNE
jgi:hypothetical protein